MEDESAKSEPESEPPSPSASPDGAPETPDPIQVQVKELPGLHGELTSAATRTGIGPEEAGAIVSGHLSAQCMQCKLTLAGDELAELATVEGTSIEGNSKLTRILQGYCGRNGCDSFYYSVTFAFHQNLDWPRILDERSNPSDKPIPDEVYLTRADRLKERLRSVDKRLWLALAIAAVLVILKSFEWREMVGQFRQDEFKADTNSPSFQTPYR